MRMYYKLATWCIRQEEYHMGKQVWKVIDFLIASVQTLISKMNWQLVRRDFQPMLWLDFLKMICNTKNNVRL